MDEEERQRVNPFEWKTAFPEVFKQGGFDAVLGNPPYGATITQVEGIYYGSKFLTFKGTKDVYTLFIEKGISLLCNNGKISLIIPSSWTGGPQYIGLREFLLKREIDPTSSVAFKCFF